MPIFSTLRIKIRIMRILVLYNAQILGLPSAIEYQQGVLVLLLGGVSVVILKKVL